MLYVELDKGEPVLEELTPLLSHKQPKIIAATFSALTSIYHAFGCKTIDPKPVLKALPKAFGHADKNVRAEAQGLTVELYRWLKDAIKPVFWNDLKPVQQQDLEKLFEKVKDEPPPKQERLLRSQQAAIEAAPRGAVVDGDEAEEEAEEEAEPDLDMDFAAVDVMPKIPANLLEQLASSKWKDRKEALDGLHAALDKPRIKEGPFDDIMRALAKCMKDANISVVCTAANCIELFAKGLRKSFAKYRSTVMAPLMERLKEKKQNVTDAIGAALDAVFAATSIPECLEEILEFLKHKNPQVKLESTKFLIRCLKSTREAPQPAEVKTIADDAKKLLTESQEVQRSAGAEVLGALWKIMGDRIMNPHFEGLDEIRKTKIKEYYETVQVKAKYKPKAAAAPPPKPANVSTQKKAPGKRAGMVGPKKAAPARVASPIEDPAPALAPRPSSRPGLPKPGPAKSGLATPSSGLKLPKKSGLSGVPPPTASPKRQPMPPTEEPAAPVPRLGLGRGLAGRPLGKPSSTVAEAPAPTAPPPSGLSLVERAELEELRAEVERLRRQNEDLRTDRTKLNSQVTELQNQNAQLIEDHTRDVLSIKAKETQLVRARSDAEAAEQTVQTQQREVERLKRELSRQVRATSPGPLDVSDHIFNDNASVNGAYPPPIAFNRSRSYPAEGKENISLEQARKLSPTRAVHTSQPPPYSSGGRSSPSVTSASDGISVSNHSNVGTGNGAESWKRAAEVTQNLKARIELMKVSPRQRIYPRVRPND